MPRVAFGGCLPVRSFSPCVTRTKTAAGRTLCSAWIATRLQAPLLAVQDHRLRLRERSRAHRRSRGSRRRLPVSRATAGVRSSGGGYSRRGKQTQRTRKLIRQPGGRPLGIAAPTTLVLVCIYPALVIAARSHPPPIHLMHQPYEMRVHRQLKQCIYPSNRRTQALLPLFPCRRARLRTQCRDPRMRDPPPYTQRPHP